jgi:hypothetical protein
MLYICAIVIFAINPKINNAKITATDFMLIRYYVLVLDIYIYACYMVWVSYPEIMSSRQGNMSFTVIIRP